MDWPNETVFEFLDFFEQESVIWNPSCPNHKNRYEVNDAWRRIEDNMGKKFSISELKKKKDSLMAIFRTCLKKVKGSTKSGAGAQDIYKPHWFAYQKMASFLQDKDQPRNTINSQVYYHYKLYLNKCRYKHKYKPSNPHYMWVFYTVCVQLAVLIKITLFN